MRATSTFNDAAGENSNDECCVCGNEWSEGQHGWVLCDTTDCENTVCSKCTSTYSLSVSDLFYCPVCAGSGDSAAATAGGALATAVTACTELEKLPQSFKTTRRILTNLLDNPKDMKYRKLRLENKSVKELVDLEPVLNILTSVGFVRTHTQSARQGKADIKYAHLPPTEEVLLLEGPLPTAQVNELLQILNGLAPEEGNNDIGEKENNDRDESSSNEVGGKRESSTDTNATGECNNKKQKGTKGNEV